MNQSNVPSLAENAAAAGVVFNPTTEEVPAVDRKALEIACVDMICKLEHLFAKAKSAGKEDFVDQAPATAQKMLNFLKEFSKQFLAGQAADQANEEIDKALTASHACKEVLKRRSWKNAVLRAFCSVEESDEIKAAHALLGEAMIRACAATLYHAVMMVGCDTSLGRQIDESTVVFVTELKHTW